VSASCTACVHTLLDACASRIVATPNV
jgi:hypothetical protein